MNTNNNQREIFSVTEAANFLGVTKGFMYKVNYRGEIPRYAPTGKNIFYLREDLLKWLTSKRIPTRSEILRQEAEEQVRKSARRHCNREEKKLLSIGNTI